MTRTLDIAVIAGDGIGPEVTAEALKVLRVAAGVEVTTTDYPYSAAHYLETGEVLTDDDLAALAKHEAIVLGAVGGDPRDGPFETERARQVGRRPLPGALAAVADRAGRGNEA